MQSLLVMGVLLAPLFLLKHRVAWEDWWPWIAFPLILQLLILFIPGMIRRRTGKGWFVTIYFLFALFPVSVTFSVASYMGPYKSALPLSLAIQKNIPFGAAIYQYGMSLYGIDFYTGMRTPIVDDIGEERYGSEQLTRVEKERYFLTSDSFFRLVRENDGIYCATKSGESLERLKKEVPGLQVLWHNDAYYLVRLKRS